MAHLFGKAKLYSIPIKGKVDKSLAHSTAESVLHSSLVKL